MRGFRRVLILLVGLLGFNHAVAQTPQVNNGAPAESFLGEQFCFDANFSNVGSPGFGPYLRLDIPPDLAFDSATIFGASAIINNVGVFPAAPGNQLTDPLSSSPITGAEGNRLIILQLPVGSVVTDGPDLDLDICLTIEPTAVVGVPLDVSLTPVYQFGDTATGVNGPITGAADIAPVTPTVILFDKVNSAPEMERTPGPSWPYTYTLVVDIANTATIDPLQITDVLPANIQFIGPVNIAGGAGCAATSTPSTITPGGTLVIDCSGSTVGTTVDNDIVITYPVYITDVLDETNCGTTLLTNNATLMSTYQPSVGGPQPLPALVVDSNVTAKHVAIQKGVAPGSASPGDGLTYTLNFQVSDFADANALVATDILPDGLQFIAHSAMTVNGGAVAITPTVNTAANGETTIIYDIGAVTGTLAAGTAVSISYTAEVLQLYVDTGEPVLASDSLSNTVVADYDLVQGAANCADGSGATVNIIPVGVSKAIQNPQPFYVPGEAVTFELTLQIPSGDTSAIQFVDAFPLPVFDVTTIDLTFGNDIRLGAADTLGLTPTAININAATNELLINWPDVNTGMPETIQVEVDVTVTTDPFADGLFLTNIFQVSTENTAGQQAQANNPVQLLIGAPDMVITKGVAAIDNPNATIAPAPATLPVDGDVTDADGGDQIDYLITVENIGSAQAFDVVITDTVPTGLTGCALLSVTDGNATPLANTGDLFAAGLSLTNPLAANDGNPMGGGAPFGADTALITFRCSLAAGVMPQEVIDNQASVSWASEGGAVTFPSRSDNATATIATPSAEKFFIATSEPATSDGANPPRATIGEIIRYRLAARLPEGTYNNLQLRDALPSGLTFLNDGTATAAFISNGAGLNSSAAPGIPNLGGAAADPGSVPSAAIGFPLPGGAITGGPFGNGDDPIFNFGLVSNNDSDADAEFLVVEFNAVLGNLGGSNIGANRDNNFQILNNGLVLDTSNNVRIRIAEPVLNTTKIATPTAGDAGDAISYTVTVAAAGGANNSNAYDVRITDALPAGLTNFMVNSITPAGGCTGITDNSTAVALDISVADMPPGCSLTIIYSAQLTAAVAPGSAINNTATAIWTSLPGSNGTAGNPTGSTTPGAPGSATGERDGSGGNNDYADSDNATVTVQSVVLDKAVVMTSEPSTGTAQGSPLLSDLTIGETADFVITATIPEGTTPQVVITDNLPANAAGVMEVVSAAVISVGANLTPANSPALITINDASLADGRNDQAVFDFGQVVNTADGISDTNDQIVVTLTARLVDEPVNVTGDQLTNTALVQFGPGLNASATATVDVVEPLLRLNKSGNITQGDAGDTVTFTLTLDHTAASTADAFDVALDDTLPVGLTLVGGSLMQSSGPPADAINEVGNGIQVTWASYPLGSVSVITFQATIDNIVMPSEVITNVASTGWSSLPGADPSERVFNTTENHAITVTAPGLVKVITATSEGDTGTAQFGPETDLTIGEQVTYQFTVVIPEGTTNSAEVVDQLPTGSSVLNVVSSRIVSIGAQISGGTLPAIGDPGIASDTNADTFNDRITWTLGDLSNAPDGALNSGDEITFEVIAVVLDQPVNQSGVTAQVNTASLTTATSMASGTVAIDIVAPEVTLAKTVLSPAGGFVDAGDTVTHRLTIDHTANSTADAYNLIITDTLPSPGLAWINDVTVSSNCPGLITDSSAAPVITFTIPQLDLTTDNCNISYDTLVENTVQPSQTLTNTAVMDYDSTPVFVAGETRRLMASDSAEVTVLAPTLVKVSTVSNVADTGSSQGNPALPDLAIGETITYELTIVVPEGTTNNAVVTDLLPADNATGVLEAIGASVISVGGNISTTLPGTPMLDDFQLIDGLNDRVVFDFGNILNLPDGLNDANDRIIMQVVARVADVAANMDGDLLVNNAAFDFTGGTLVDDADVEVVEPALNITKSMGPLVDSIARISISVENTGAAPAYDIDVSDVLEDSIWNTAMLTPVSVSAGFDLNTVAGPGPGQTTVTFTSDPLAVSPAGTIPAGATVSAVFDIPLAALPPAPNPIPNQADLNGSDTLPGNDPAARALPPDSATAQLGVPDLSLSKQAALLVDADGSTDVSPGDTLRYTLVARNNGPAAATNVVVDDIPDSHTALVVGSVTTTQGSVAVGNTAGDAVVQVTIGGLAAAAAVTITYDVVIVDPLPDGVTEVVNQAVLRSTELPPIDSDDPTPPGGNDPTIVPVNAAPDLNIVKDDGGISVMPGDTVIYTLSYQNVGNQDAVGVVITDTVPANSVFSPAASTTGWSCAPDNNAGSSCTLNIGGLAAGGGGSADFAVIVDLSLPSGVDELLNTASIADDGSNGADPTPADNSDSDNTPIVAVPDLTLVKDDGGVMTVPGGVIAYTLSYQNVGNQDATGVVITDAVPANTVFNAAASTAGWACVPDNNAGSVCTLAIGSLAAGGNGAATFAVTVANPLAAGVDTILNNASIADDGANGADPTPGNNTDNDQTPVAATPDMVITKDDGGITAMPGDTVIYTLNYQNVGNQNATGVVITETVPVGSSFNAAASTAGWVCLPDGSAGSNCTLAIGAVAGAGGGGSVSFALTIDNPLAAGIDQLINTAAIGDDGSNGADPTPGNNSDGDTTPLNAAPDMAVSKDDGGITAAAGDTVVYTLTYQNLGNQDATGVILTESVPANTVFNPGASTAGWLCAPDNNAGSACTLAIGAVAGSAGGSADFAVTIDNPLAAGVDQIDNVVSISDDGNNGPDSNPDNNDGGDSTPVDATPDLVITKDDGGASVAPGGVVTYTLSYQNVGDQAATTIEITETVPADTTFNAAASDAGWVCAPDGNAGSSCVFAVGTVAGGGAGGSVLFAVTVNNPLPILVTEIINNASIADDGDNGPDPTPGNNSDGDTTPVGAFPDLTLVKSDGDASVEPGETVVYTLSYSNVGDQDATGVVITDTVPANTTFDPAASTAGWSCTPDNNAGSVCTFTVGNLNVGDSGSVLFAVMVDAPLAAGVTEILNAASISDDGTNGPDITPADNDSSDNTPVRLNPPLGLKIGEVDLNGVITWTMWWFNNDNQSDLPTLITDNIPNGTEYIANSLTCTAEGASQCISAGYNSALDRIEVETIIAPDFGAAVDSLPAELNNEVLIVFRTRALSSGIFENQAAANWDGGNDGSPVDDQDGGQAPVTTDDPVTLPQGDPTALGVALAIPALSRWSMLFMFLLLLGIAAMHLSAGERKNRQMSHSD